MHPLSLPRCYPTIRRLATLFLAAVLTLSLLAAVPDAGLAQPGGPATIQLDGINL